MADDPKDATREATECPKCGALLPDDDEGLCPVCGRAFGRPTDAMPQLTPEVMRQYGYTSADARAIGLGEQAAAEADRRSNKRVLWISVALLSVIVVLTLVLFWSLR